MRSKTSRSSKSLRFSSRSISKAKALDDHRLLLTLDNGKELVRDMTPLLEQATGVLEPLLNAKFFSRVRAKHGTVVWPGDIDLCPDCVITGRF